MQFFRNVALVGLLALPVIGGCKPADSPRDPVPDTNAPPVVAPAPSNTPAAVPVSTSTNAAASGSAEAPPVAAGQPEVPLAVNRPIPDHLTVSAALEEVIKLTQAGVAEEILLAFVNNSGSSFRLGADEIIYLTDIGVPSMVINSMMERDRILATSVVVPGMPAAAAATSATQALAVAPTYVDSPAEEAVATPTAAADNLTAEDFQEALSPYGTWIEVEGYGRCWQPTVVVSHPGWRPYCDGGRWIYTDCGWYWYSDYSWGWAPFHYGRWFSHPRWGWCWYPDYTWGPAWVTWSYTDAYCGWAPLPPAAVYTGAGFTYYGSAVSVGFGFGLGFSYYSYVPWRHFCDYRPWRYCAPRPQCKEIYDRATCHNDYTTDHQRRVVNRGLPPERVSAYAQTEVRRARLQDVPGIRPAGSRQEELDVDGRTLAVRRPGAASAAPAAVTRPTRTSTTRDGLGTTPPPIETTAPVRASGRDRSPAPTAGPVAETVGRNSMPVRQPRTRPDRDKTTPRLDSDRQPVVVVGNGDGQPATPNGWSPYDNTQPSRPTPRTELSPTVTQIAENPPQPAPDPQTALPPASWTPPGRPEPAAQPQVIRVGRSVQDRPTGSSTYRIYSSPQRGTTEASGSDNSPPVVNNPGHSRSPEPVAPVVNTESGSESYQPARPRNNGSSYQSERSGSPRSQPSAPPPARPETRETPPPSRSESSRGESGRSESRPTPTDPGRGSPRGR